MTAAASLLARPLLVAATTLSVASFVA